MRFLTTFGLMLILAGCGNAKWTSIYREYKISDSYDTQNALIDAKQRAILSSPIIKGGGKDGGDGRAFIVCAEPSPDAVSALSSALSASLGVDIAGKGGGSGSFASALTEAVGKLGKRNATIQLLRDGFYRQCEAYLNGVLDKDGYKATSDRYTDAMVTLLAIEQVTSPTAGDAPLVIRSGTASADTNVTIQRNDPGTQPKDSKQAESEQSKDTNKSAEGEQSKEDSTPGANSQKDSKDESDKPQGGEPANQGLTTGGKASAGGGDVNINLSAPETAKVDEKVAAEVTKMVKMFLDKNIQDKCLQRIGGIVDTFMLNKDSKYKDLMEDPGINSYITMCKFMLLNSLNDNLPEDVSVRFTGEGASNFTSKDPGEKKMEMMEKYFKQMFPDQ
jgi:hypothetical protein